MPDINISKIKTTHSSKYGKAFTVYEINNSFILSVSENKTHRKIFRACIHQADDETRLDGQVICQRKSQKDKWEDLQKIILSKMKAGQEIAIDLKGEEIAGLSVLFDEIQKNENCHLKCNSLS